LWAGRRVQTGAEGHDLLGGHRMARLCSTVLVSCGRGRRTRWGAVHLSRATPSWALQESAQPATMGWPGPVARRMGVPAPVRAGLRVAARPDARLHRVPWLTGNQGPGGKRVRTLARGRRSRRPPARHTDDPQTIPSALMLWLDAEHWQRGNGSSRQQGGAQLEQGVPPTLKGGSGRSTKGRERGTGSGFPSLYGVTLRRSPEAPQPPVRGEKTQYGSASLGRAQMSTSVVLERTPGILLASVLHSRHAFGASFPLGRVTHGTPAQKSKWHGGERRQNYGVRCAQSYGNSDNPCNYSHSFSALEELYLYFCVEELYL
jgi:hypothetical protein